MTLNTGMNTHINAQETSRPVAVQSVMQLLQCMLNSHVDVTQLTNQQCKQQQHNDELKCAVPRC
jgi:hypothetical protein